MVIVIYAIMLMLCILPIVVAQRKDNLNWLLLYIVTMPMVLGCALLLNNLY